MRLCMFDLDGTLGYVRGGEGAWFAGAVQAHFGDVPVDMTWESYPQVTDTGIVRSLYREHVGREPTREDHDAICADFLQRLEGAVARGDTEFVPVAGARRAVADLPGRHGWRIALATGGWRRSALWKLRRGGLDLSGHAQAFADDAPAREDVMRTALHRAREAAGRDFERVVYVGDGSWDVRACRTLGWPFVGVAPTDEHATRLRDLGASHVLPDLADLDLLLTALADAAPP